MTFAIPPPPPHAFIFQANLSCPPSYSFQTFQRSTLLGSQLRLFPLLFSQKSSDPPLKSSSSSPPPPTGVKYRPVPNPRTITSGTQGNDSVMQTQALPPSSRARRVSLAPKTPFPFPFKRLPRKHCVPGMHCKLTVAQQPVVLQFIFRSYLFVTIYAFLFR